MYVHTHIPHTAASLDCTGDSDITLINQHCLLFVLQLPPILGSHHHLMPAIAQTD